MRSFIYPFVFSSLLLFSSLGFGQVQSQDLGSKSEVSMAAISQVPPFAPSVEAWRLKFLPNFEPQFGLGVTAIPVQGLWDLEWGDSFYHGGFQINFLWRVHPRVTLELNGEALFSNSSNSTRERFSESGLSLGVRVFLLKIPDEPRKFHVMPYVSLGPQISGLFPGFEYSYAIVYPSGAQGYLYGNSPVVYFGGFVGVGVELRFGTRFALNLEVKGLAQGLIDIDNLDNAHIFSRLGVRGSVGFSVYF